MLAGGIAVIVGAVFWPAAAQQPQPRSAAKSPAATGKPSAKEEPSSRNSDGALRQRVEHLEEQLVDMQVTIGTLESLARPGGAGEAAAAPTFRPGQGGDADQARIETLETQVRALTNQLEQMADQIRQLGGRRGEAGVGAAVAGRDADLPRSDPSGGSRQGASADVGRTSSAGGFGSTTVTPGQGRDPIGRLITTDPDPRQEEPARNTAGVPSGNPRELYETAYGYLLQQDYSGAEVSFEEFLRLYPSDRLAPDAQYWLGESLYVQRRYKPAAQAFLKVIQVHQSSAKVPNSMLKLAMTLEQLGQKDCALFNELDGRVNATPDIKSKARVVRQRVGC